MNEYRPYVISTDLHGLFTRWGRSEGFVVPNEDYFLGLRNDLVREVAQITGVEVLLLEERELRRRTNEAIKRSSLPVVSLDRAYVGTNLPNIRGFLDMSRAVDGEFKKLGLMPRIGSCPLEVQYAALRSNTPLEVALVDDVIFHGDGVKEAADNLAKHSNLIVRKVLATVGIQSGVAAIESNGMEVEVIVPLGDVFDEVCERDFFPAVPMSGRTLVVDGELYSAPYMSPYGNPAEWASIPTEHVPRFSDTCRRLSIDLWSKVEQINRAEVITRRAPRRVIGFLPEKSIVYNLRHN